MSVLQSPQPDPIRPGWTLGGHEAGAAVAALAARAFDPHFREAWTEYQIIDLLRAGNAWLDLGHVDGVLVAFALNRQVLDEVELLLCAVSADWRGRGVGSRMMEQVRKSALSRGARRLFLEVRDGNEAALGLYRTAGFNIEGRRPAYYKTLAGDSIDAITFAMRVE
ncbi:MAG: ribosomal-protein-alanine acetyltransferase [Sphingomonas sp.]|nr:MAG: ribosomal-protein-alanine acetyltransferase [Sphingomonas sp.]